MTDPESLQRVRAHLQASAEAKRRTAEACAADVVTAAQLISSSLQAGGKLLLCGNGGSAADCQHLAAEFTNRLSTSRERPALAALALTTDTSFLTSMSNDYGFAHVFERQVQALGRPGDVLMGISTSGNAENVLLAVRFGRLHGLRTIGLLGGSGGHLRQEAELSILVPETSTQHIQEVHIAIGHILCDLVERCLFDGGV